MNTQPFYHSAEIMSDHTEKQLREILSCPSVLDNTVELCGYELLFTATEDMADKAIEMLRSAGVGVQGVILSEAGDPADLLIC